MDRVTPTLVIVSILVLVFVGLALAWRARHRRQSDLPTPAIPPLDLGRTLATKDLFYVATSHADAPTDRIVVGGLGFRARCGVTVAEAGIVLAIAGSPDVFIPTAELVGVGRASWTIDRAVTSKGLVFIRWRLGAVEVDSYLRDQGDEILAAVESLLPVGSTSLPSPTSPGVQKDRS